MYFAGIQLYNLAADQKFTPQEREREREQLCDEMSSVVANKVT